MATTKEAQVAGIVRRLLENAADFQFYRVDFATFQERNRAAWSEAEQAGVVESVSLAVWREGAVAA